MKKRLSNIDLYKGALILLVILGHIIDANPFFDVNRNNSLSLAIIYSFHIPIFIGLSGYLLNVEKIINLNLLEIFEKYKFRVILPWIIAALSYFPFSDNFEGGLWYPLKAIFITFYHLWFIPAFLFWIILTWILKKMSLINRSLLIASFIITLVAVAVKKYSSDYVHVINVFKPYYYFFFAFGVYIRKLKNKKLYVHEFMITAISLMAVIYFYYFPNKILSTLNLFLLNAALLLILIKTSTSGLLNRNKFLEWVGRNSLGLYLWHVMPIVVVEKLIETTSLVMFYGSIIICEILFFILYYYLSKVHLFKKYIFGL